MENTESKSNTKSIRIYQIIILVLALTIIWLVYDKYTTSKETTVIIQKLEKTTNQKDSVEKDLKQLLTDYEGLKTSNTKINAQLQEQQTKIQNLIDELKNIKASNYSKIEEYKQQVATLRAILRSYIVQIDSLNTKNKILVAENKKVKETYEEVQTQNKELEKNRDSLKGQVKIASVIKGINLSVLGLNKKGKETNRNSKLDKFKVTITLTENVIAQKGNKEVFIRIAGPDKKILTNNNSGFFKFKGEEIAYSAKNDIDYLGKNIEVSIFYSNIQELLSGIYYFDVFVDGNQIGTTSLKLK